MLMTKSRVWLHGTGVWCPVPWQKEIFNITSLNSTRTHSQKSEKGGRDWSVVLPLYFFWFDSIM